MFVNYKSGGSVELVAPYDRTAGQGALIGSIFGLADSAISSGSVGRFLLDGTPKLDKTSAQAWAQGDKIYWDDASKRCDNTNVGPLIGTAAQAAANPSSSGFVTLNGSTAPRASAIADIATADGSDAGTTQTLANATKAKLNALIDALRVAGVIAP